MDIVWDPIKAHQNLVGHGVDFADASTVLNDDLALTIVDEHPQETRYVSLGEDAMGRLLVVVYTMRDEVYRLISARRATKQERKRYEGSS